MKIFGLKGCLIYLLLFGFFTIVLLLKMHVIGAFLLLAFYLHTALNTVLFIVKDGVIVVWSLNPFKKRNRIYIKDVTKVVFEVNRYFSKIIFSLGAIDQIISTQTSVLGIKFFYKYLRSIGIDVESKGSYGLLWYP